MNCRRATQMMPLYAGGELAPKKARRLARHLESCSDCREMAEELRTALSGYKAAIRQDEFDWPEAEWKSLMERIKTQPPPRRIVSLGATPRAAWATGAAALLLLAGLTTLVPRTGLLRHAPVPLTETLASTELQPGRSLEFGNIQVSHPRQDIPFSAGALGPRAIESETLVAALAEGKESQDVVSMTLVSQETGLKVHWTLNRNFEWKVEEKR